MLSERPLSVTEQVQHILREAAKIRGTRHKLVVYTGMQYRTIDGYITGKRMIPLDAAEKMIVPVGYHLEVVKNEPGRG